MSSLLIFKCPMSHGTMKYKLKAHAFYFVLIVWWYTDVYQTMKCILGKLKTMKRSQLKLN